jgi:hypothetical protein
MEEPYTHNPHFLSDIWSYSGTERADDCEGEQIRMQRGQPEIEPSESGPYAPVWQVSVAGLHAFDWS